MFEAGEAMAETHPFIDELESEAKACEMVEAEFRRTMKERVETLVRERAFAFRRVNLMRSLFATVAQAEAVEIATAGATAALRHRLGWVEETPARDEVLTEYATVAAAAFRMQRPAVERDETPEAGQGEDARPDARGALADFESWYLQTRGKPFWVLFEHYMPETQLVDF